MSPRGPQSVMNQMIEDALQEAWPDTFTRRGTVFRASSGHGVDWLLEGEPERHARKKGEFEFTLGWGVDVPGWDEILLAEHEYTPPKTKRVSHMPVFARVYDVTPVSATGCWWTASVESEPPRRGLLSRLLTKTTPLPEAIVAMRQFLTTRMATPEQVERFLVDEGYGKVAPAPPDEFVETIAALQILQGRKDEAEASLTRLREMARQYDSAQIAHRIQVLSEFLDGRRVVGAAD